MQFSEKFDYLLNTSGLSNSKLSKKIFVDASLVSKWRRGVKVPRKKQYFIQIAEAVAHCFRDEYLRRELSELSQIPMEQLKTHHQIKSTLVEWLKEGEEKKAIELSEPNIHMFSSLNVQQSGCIKALQTLAERLKGVSSVSCLRFYSDESYERLQFFATQLDAIEEQFPAFYKKIERVSMLLSGVNGGEKEYRSRWDIMDRFANHCEVSVAILDDRYFVGVFQHTLLIIEEVGVVATFGFCGSNTFGFAHMDGHVVKSLCKDYDALLSRSQVALMEYPHYSAIEEAICFQNMLLHNTDIYYRSHDIPPALIPHDIMELLVYPRLRRGCKRGIRCIPA